MHLNNSRKSIIALSALIAGFTLAPTSFAQQPGDVYMWEFNEGTGVSVQDNSKLFSASLGLPMQEGDLPQSSADSPTGQANDRSVVVGAGLVADDSASPVLNIQSGPITMEAWINLSGLNASNGIGAYGASYKLGINNGFLVWTFYGIEDVASTVPVDADNQWHHVAAAWEPGVGVTFYFDGVDSGFVATTNAGRELQNNRLNIGSETDGGSPLPGLLDRFRIHQAVLTAADLDSNAASPKAPLASTVVAYSFNESGTPYANSTTAVRPANAMAILRNEITAPKFSQDDPKGGANDYSLYFDGTDRVTFVDTQDIMQFDYEDFTFEGWLKFNSEEQIVTRPILLAYGIGGQNGYSFSFRNTKAPKPSTDTPSGMSGDYSVLANALVVDDSANPVFDLREGPITVEAWYKADDLSGFQDILSYGDSYKVGVNEGRFVFTFRAIEDVLSTVTAPVDGQWHHIAYAWEPGVGVTFYLDGAEVDFVATANTSRELQSSTLNIGSGHQGGSIFPGLLDRVRLHNAVLTATDLDSNAALVKAPLASTVAAYNFDEGQAPYASAASAARPAEGLYEGPTVAVTAYGILDAYSNAAIPDDGQWHHIAAAHQNGVELRFYVDGKLEDTLPYTDGVTFAMVNEFIIGSEAGGGNPYVGLLDRLKVTRGALIEGQLDYFAPVTAVLNWSLF